MFNSTQNPTLVSSRNAPVLTAIFLGFLFLALMLHEVGSEAVSAMAGEWIPTRPVPEALPAIVAVIAPLLCGFLVDRVSLVTSFSLAFAAQSAILAFAAFNHWPLGSIACIAGLG